MKWSIQFFVLLLVSFPAVSQRRLTEATLRYSISLADTTDRSLVDLFKSAQYTCYLKGINSRTDLVTGMGKQTTLLLGKNGTAVLIKEFGSQRYLTKLTAAQWNSLNQKYEDCKLDITEDTTRLLGFLCKKAIITLQDGTQHGAWFTTEVSPVYRDFQLMAKRLPGLLMQYETVIGKSSVIYRIVEINYNPVPQALFDVPNSGYRLLEFEKTN
jgi:GLPGLI family protein